MNTQESLAWMLGELPHRRVKVISVGGWNDEYDYHRTRGQTPWSASARGLSMEEAHTYSVRNPSERVTWQGKRAIDQSHARPIYVLRSGILERFVSDHIGDW